MREKIAKLYSLYEEIENVERRATDLLNAAKDSGKDAEIEIERDGKVISVKEKHLWREVLSLGTDSSAAGTLKKKYPDVFEAYAEQNRLADDLRTFTIQEFRIDYTALKMTDIVRLFEMMFDYRITQPATATRTTFLGRLGWLLTGK
jgi:predicted phage-related endonuclease